MKRRDFVKALGAGAALAGGLAACGQSAGPSTSSRDQARRQWNMVTTWPQHFPGLGTGAARLAETITRMSGGRITVKVHAAGELVPALEVFDAVASGSVELGHGAAYYWKGKVAAAQLFAAVPFGMNAQEMHAWLYHGGGLALWQEIYQPFGVRPYAAGNTGVQMGGWFNKEIRSVADLDGLRMRIPGLGGEILQRAGGVPVTLPGGEIFTSLKTGVIDATEWVGPWNDLAFGLHEAAKYYYYPGWHEPGSVLECLVNQAAFDALPDDLRQIVEIACQATTLDMLSEFTASNPRYLKALTERHGIELRRFPPDVLVKLKSITQQLLAEMAAADPVFDNVFQSYQSFFADVRSWHEVSEAAWFDARR